jgi:hypothetical protein
MRLIPQLQGLTVGNFSRHFKGSAVKRTKRRGLLRNVAVALGNWGSPEEARVLYHHVSRKHLHRYCTHKEYLYNTRAGTDGERVARLIRLYDGKRLTRKAYLA